MQTNLKNAREIIKKRLNSSQKARNFADYVNLREFGQVEKDPFFEEVKQELENVTFVLNQGRYCSCNTTALSYLLVLVLDCEKLSELYEIV
jgi:hypothetical protein